MKPEEVPDGPLLLDTDVLSFITLAKGPRDRFVPLISGHVLALSFATVGELLASTWRPGSVWSDEHRAELQEKLRLYLVITATDQVTAVWAQMHVRFDGRLGDGGANDMWIAACAVGQPTPLPVVTNNRRHFDLIAREFPTLRVVHPDA